MKMPSDPGRPPPLGTFVAMPGAAPAVLVEDHASDVITHRPGVLFVTDELFLPHHNGSARIYEEIDREFTGRGWRTHCLSFFRDPRLASSQATLSAYADRFRAFLLAPGWNLGGRPLGKLGMAQREIVRWLSGDIFSSHSFLAARTQAFRSALQDFIDRHDITQVYFHKLHTALLLRPAFDVLSRCTLTVDLHDDFVTRSQHYDAAYDAVFAALPWPDILRRHRAMYVRHRLGRTDLRRSRRHETALLSPFQEIRVASDIEFEGYARIQCLQGRLRHVPWNVAPPGDVRRLHAIRPFHAGFIGADSVMNLDAVIHLRDHVLPLIRRAMPEFRMLVAGKVAASARMLLDGVPNVELWHELPDVRSFYDAIMVACVPLRYGTGVSVKAIEALAYGCPLVTTSVGVRGVGALVAANPLVTIADTEASFADALLTRTIALATHPRKPPASMAAVTPGGTHTALRR